MLSSVELPFNILVEVVRVRIALSIALLTLLVPAPL